MIRMEKTYKSIGGFLFIVVMSFLLMGCEMPGSNTGGQITPGSQILPVQSKANEVSTQKTSRDPDKIYLTGVFSYLNAEENMMHYMDISNGNEYEVKFAGSTYIYNKYDTVITTNRMRMGGIYDVVCDKNGTAITINESKDAWEYSEVKNFSANVKEQVLSIADNTFKYYKDAVILSRNDRITAEEIMTTDVVTVRGMDKTAYSVVVDRGHGYMKLSGVNDFIGGYIDIGNDFVYVITKDMLITVPEGDYKVSVQNTTATLSGSKQVTIVRDKESSVDFSEYKTNAVKNGTIEFSVTPMGAVMYIDGTQVDYSKPITLDYGRHVVKLMANYYASYEEVFIVSQNYEKKIIDMSISSDNQSKSNNQTASTKSNGSNTATSAPNYQNTVSPSSTMNRSTMGIVNGTVPDLTQGFYVNIKTPTGAAVYVNNNYVGIAPTSVEKKAGNMVIALTMPGHETKSYSVEIPNSTGDINYTFPELTPRLSTQADSSTIETRAN